MLNSILSLQILTNHVLLKTLSFLAPISLFKYVEIMMVHKKCFLHK